MRQLRITVLFLLLAFMLAEFGFSQSCPINSLGQNPSTAFPVCGTNTFEQAQVNLCGGRKINSPKCNSGLLEDVNPYYYKFTCYEAGTLGFMIEPNSPTSDYDWQVFDITNRNPNDIFTDVSMGISSNWSQYFGETGTTANAANTFECEGTVPKYSKMPTLVKGHEYLLLVSHFTNTQAGYKLVFGGGTASITDTTIAHIKTMSAHCSGTRIFVKLNKAVKCSSIANNGSDFKINTPGYTILSAQGIGCTNGFDTDSLILTLAQPLIPGIYEIESKKGTDGNTLLDNCDNALVEGEKKSIQLIPYFYSPIEAVTPVGCRPDTVSLSFSTLMTCQSIAANGSDFSITGPSAVSIKSATGVCNADGLSQTIKIILSQPITVGGTYTVSIKTGTDGNTIFNECLKESPAGETIQFTAYDTVSAKIDYTILEGCKVDTLMASHAGANNVNTWSWGFSNRNRASTQTATRTYSSGQQVVGLKVSNGVCSDSSSITLDFDKNRVKAIFTSPKYVCPFDTAFFADSSKGRLASWNWDFGNGNISTDKMPPYQFYPNLTSLQEYTCSLLVIDSVGCRDSASAKVIVPGNCYIAVPTAFTPNGDGLNDYLYPLSAYKATDLSFKVYNRYGQLVWQTTDWTIKWDGTVNGSPQGAGTYVWHLSYTDDKNVPIKLQGTSTLIR